MPLLIFAFISIFGVHHFVLKTYFPEVDAAGEVVYTAAGDTVFQQVPDFSLISQQGVPFSSSDLEGNITVVYFFSTDCPDCDKISSQLVRIQEGFEKYPEVRLVSITATPEQDTQAALQAYAAKYGARKGKWFFLTGDRQEILGLAQEGFDLPVGKERLLRTDQLLLVDSDKRVRGIYDGTNQKEIDRLITETNVLRDGYSKSK
ncbi:SCO family protein [Pontibacter sp. E15-1]|uniref:SCO family protein n=1 Tax=Pontibacter sp. E15-1 TaxID=2919918 RepID=UPI001F4F86F3|nr:SCO family protein [Pontibacter sp. E15-1]MCJ8165277.1 SCO family protein [Pontibacter sp. E15-1]